VNTALEQGNAQEPGEAVASAQFALLEREGELAAIDALIGSGLGGGRLLAIEGPPGIGKTALLAETKTRAEEAGMLVLSARGSELEREFPYGVVRQLFESQLAFLPDEERAELLAGAAALAAPVFDPTHLANERTSGPSFAILHGLFWLTANAAARRPLLLAVDDLHWCDAASLRWLAYLVPRIEGLPLIVIVGLRPAEPGADPVVLGQILSDPLTLVIRPAPLSMKATTEFVRDRLGADADDLFCAACHDESDGNPLLLQELTRAMSTQGFAPTAEKVPRLRELGAQAVARAVSLRLARLAPEATMLARAVAILGDGAESRHAAALAELDDEAAAEAAAALVRADILRAPGPLGFAHPVVRAAVYSALTPVERDSGHSRAARLLAETGAEPERIAAHLLVIPPEGEPRVVEVLRESASRALGRGAAESAVTYLCRALAENPADRGRLLLELGSAEALINGPAAVEHLREALALIDDPAHRARTALLLGRQLFFLHRVDESVGAFKRGIEELAGADAELGRLLEVGLINNAIMEPRLYPVALERLEQLRDEPADKTVGQKMVLAMLAYNDARANLPAVEAVALARRALADDELLAAENGGVPFISACMVLAMADLDEALEIYDASLADAHRRGSVFAFAAAKVFRAETYLYRGELVEAEVDGREALAACDAWGIGIAAGWLIGYLADVLMEQGKLEDAAAVLARGGFAGDPATAHAHWFHDSRARFRILRGDLRQGLEETLEAGRYFEAVGGQNPAFMPWRSQAALALLQLGQQDEAHRLAEEELELARTWGAPRALGRALRAAGLAEGGDEGLALLEEAVEVLSDSPARLEHAKALTELGAALRRTNRRSQAREQLRRAVERATNCGATPLVQRAETELLATGARPRRISLSGPESLTPSELRVARMAAEGPTNREIAQALFVTPKTVEVHLSSVYRKLGISSRSQLAAALAEPARAS
jgi:DNA-binding CsgD family transcriptional regulator/tetratricopeptide (TPR) repeat protein